MPRLEVRLFAVLRDRFRSSSLQVELEGPLTARALLDHLKAAHPEHARVLGSCRVAVNRRFASDEDSFVPADELALIPPVSGG